MTDRNGKARILLVEDHTDTREVLRRLLVAEGYTVHVAMDAPSAIGMAGSQRFDILISDIHLPGQSGLELMRTLAKQFGLPGIAISASAFQMDEYNAHQAGFDRFFGKPFSVRDLIAAIEEMTPPRPPGGEQELGIRP